MAGRSVDITLEDIRKEQLSLDKTIESLLAFSPSTSTTRSSNNIFELSESSGSSARSPAQVTRGRGRPPKTRNPVPPSSPVTANSVQKFSVDVVLDCVNKLNTQYKRLLDFLEYVSGDIEKHKADVV